MKFKKISMLAILPILISTALAHGGAFESNQSNGIMNHGFFGFLFMGLIIFILMLVTIWLIKEDNKR